jgi:hypothetical protein
MPSRPFNPKVKGETTLPDEDSNLDSGDRHLLDRNFRSLPRNPVVIVLVIGVLPGELEFERDCD